ncbi:MAG: hypothetical protein JXP73_10255 [Deltaproteobacteria bacterium]|nr:hypothetical protein [Deltaproteobacteria bacterium]
MLTDAAWDKIQRDKGRDNVRQPDDEEREAATRRLRKAVGRSATEPGWQDRIRVRADTNTFALAVVECFGLRGGVPEEQAWRDPSALMAPLVYYPLEEGAKVLLSGNPEEVLARRREVIAAHEKSEQAKFDAAVAVLTQMNGGSREAQEAAAREREKWAPAEWRNLAPTVRAALLLAYATENRDAALSADLKALAKSMNANGGPCPSRAWWEDAGVKV